MINRAVPVAILLATLPLSAFAQGFTGGDLGIEYNAPTDGSDFGGTTYTGGVEYGFARNFSVALNLSAYKLENINTTAANATLHLTYHMSNIASFGLFSASDGVEGDDGATYTNSTIGIEAGTDFMGGDIGGYIGRLDGDDTFTVLGVDGEYAFARGISAIGGLDLLTNNDVTNSQVSIGAKYAMQQGPEFYAKIGSTREESALNTDTSTFIGIGASVSFGAARGTTFGTRSAFESLPRF
jgi:hypothetical protein